MRGSRAACSFCGSDSLSPVNHSVSCASCSHALEERYTDLRPTRVTSEHASPLCLVTTDLSELHQFDEGEIPDDPFFSKGFITAFSQVRVHHDSAFTATARTVSGDLLELERQLGGLIVEDDAKGTSANAKAEFGCVGVENSRLRLPLRHNDKKGAEGDLRNVIHGYLQIQEIVDEVGLDASLADEAFRQFSAYAMHKSLVNKNVSALAAGCIVFVAPGRMQEVQLASGISQKEIAQHVRTLTLWNQSGSAASSFVLPATVQRICDLMHLDKETEKLTMHITERAFQQHLCGIFSHHVTSAAAAHIAQQMHNPTKSLHETATVVNLSPVILLKAYKELIENLEVLLPGVARSPSSMLNPPVPLGHGQSIPELPFRLELPHSLCAAANG